MEQRLSFVTLAVPDLAAQRAFYVDGLGWTVELEEPGEVVMIRVGERLVLSLWAQEHVEAEVGPVQQGPGLVPITLAHTVATAGEVDTVLATARAAGSRDVSAGARRAWGGYTGYVADPAGFRWEVAHNPGPIGQSVL